MTHFRALRISGQFRYLALAAIVALVLVITVVILNDRKHQVIQRTTGNDISWEQCTSLDTLPKGQAFGIVDVNAGIASNTNPCLAKELSWANKSNSSTAQPETMLYVNTGNPGDIMPAVTDWPKNNQDKVHRHRADVDPYGKCTGANDAACSWQYGFNMANLDADKRGITHPRQYAWYLDVETINSWSATLTNNAADLEGMATYFKSIGLAVGLYSTSYQWATIVGPYGASVDATGNTLNGLPSWIPGASNQANAKMSCKEAPLTIGGTVVLTQYLAPGVDYDFSCL